MSATKVGNILVATGFCCYSFDIYSDFLIRYTCVSQFNIKGNKYGVIKVFSDLLGNGSRQIVKCIICSNLQS